MEFGLALPQYDWDAELPWSTTVEAAQRAEALGFDSVWLSDHLFLDPSRYDMPAGQAFGYDPLIGLAAIGRATKTIKLGTLVIAVQLRPPTVLAKMLATLDRVAGPDRVIAGIGAGWFEPEFVAAGVEFGSPKERIAQVADAVQTMKAMWTNQPDAPPCNPAPLTAGGPPVWVAGKGDRMIELAVRHADGFNHQGWTAESGPYRFDVVRNTCERLGRDPATLTISALQAIDDFDALKRQLDAFAAEGVATVIVSVGQLPFGQRNLDAIDRVADAVR